MRGVNEVTFVNSYPSRAVVQVDSSAVQHIMPQLGTPPPPEAQRPTVDKPLQCPLYTRHYVAQELFVSISLVFRYQVLLAQGIDAICCNISCRL